MRIECKTSQRLSRHIKIHSISYKDYFDTYIEPFEHKCPWCENTRKWQVSRYNITCCSKTCRKKQREHTCLDKYGEKNNSCTQEWIEKTKATNREKFGADWKMMTDIGKNNYKITINKKYGVDNYFQTEEFKLKYKEKMLIKYGVDSNLKSDDFKRIMLERWGATCAGQSHIIAKKSRKRILFDGIWFDSTPEVNLYKFCITNNFSVKYHPCILPYIDSNMKTHIYHPDFEINGRLFEVKGEHLLKDGKLFFPFRKSIKADTLSNIDIREKAKTECMIYNNITIIPSSIIKNETELLKILKE